MSLNPLAGAIALLACAMTLPGCASGMDEARSAGNASGIGVVNAHADGETRLRPGQTLAIELDSNASTGYAWEVVEDGSPVLEPAPVPARAAPAAPPLPGAGGTSRWRYRAAQVGTTSLRLVYRRSWEKDVEPVRTAIYRVVVE